MHAPSASAPPPPTRSRRRLALALLLDFVVMGGMFALDVRDLFFKTLWLGPDDTYSFTAVGTQTLRRDVSLAQAATAALNMSTLREGDLLSRASGWTSFLAVCDDVRPIADGAFFSQALGTNCSVGPRSSRVVVPQLVFAASARADSIVWAACRLLRNDRRPVLCRAWLAQRFAERYNMAETPLLFTLASRDRAAYSEVRFTETSRPTLLPESAAETELLHLLDVVGRSAPPLSRLTCVEGFKYDGPGYYTAHLFGCGSASRFEAAFVGHHAADYTSLHQNKAFLTADALQLLGLAFLIRQNSWSLFHVTESSSLWQLEHKTFINFSSSGMLYTFAVAIDVALLLVNLSSTLELARLVFWPLVQELVAHEGERRVGTAEAPFAFEDYKAVLTSPLFRSAPIALPLLVSQLLCWMLVLPNAIIWSWTEALEGKVQAYLSTLRVWVVPLVLVNGVWNLVVFFFERRAYAITARTHVSSWEVGTIACAVTFFAQAHIFAISSTKYALDTQRVFDAVSFPGFTAFGNGYAEGQDTLQTTPWEQLVLIYRPLGDILGWTFAGITLCLAVRFAYHSWLHTPTAVVHHAFAGKAEGTARGLRRAMTVSPQSQSQPQSQPQSQAQDQTLQPQPLAEYRRLPIETLLALPIRARSLVRATHFMETSVRFKRFLRPSCYVEHGIVMEHHKLRTRRGFFGTIRYSTDAESHAMPPSSPEDDLPGQTIVEKFDPAATDQPQKPQPTVPPLRRRVLTPLR